MTVQDNQDYQQNKVGNDYAHDAEDDPDNKNYVNDAQVKQGSEQNLHFLGTPQEI